MSVFLRTGRDSAVSVSWPVYVFFVLPIQMIWLFAKALVYVFAAAIAVIVFVSHFIWTRWNERKPPHPYG